MNSKIFRSNFITSLLVLIVTIILIFGVLFEYFENQLTNELKSEATYISHALENEGEEYIDNFKNEKKRITLIDKNGVVLADTSANEDELDNHSDRDEVKEAMKDGSGTSVRYSNTLMEKTIYYAVRLDNGNILRVSTTQQSIIVILLGLIYPIIIILVIALIITLILSYRVSKSIINPINALDLEHPENNDTYEELTPLLKKISAQKRHINEQIRTAEQKQEEFRLITENMTEGFLVIDNQANLLTYNSAALKLLDITDVQEGTVLMLNRTKGFRDTVHRVLTGEHSESTINIDDKHYNLIANPVYENDRVIGAVIVILDVTEYTNREKMRSEFTSNVSHELKSPLTSISGFAEIMMAGDVPGETVVDFSKTIYKEAQRLISLVSDIIKISELDEKNSGFEQEPVELFELSKSVTERMKPVAEKRNITLNVLGGTAKVMGVSKILEEMIENLVDNAVKYNKDNGTVDVIVTSSDNTCELVVRDTGIGIPQSEQSRVFERFYCVDKSHSKLVGGTGLGLSIVKHGAMFHGAQIKLESTEGKGTSISLIFNKA
ncbi:MAG: histidine kinase [Clostridia bacterium]|nr:histidine kinase [Clostridia bacterium]